MKRLYFILLCLMFNIVFAQKVGLVLGGGAARGIAHIGVLKALEEHNIPIDAVGGTSMGAIIGGLWAAGYSAAEIESIFVNTNILNWFINDPFYDKQPAYMRLQKEQSIFNVDILKGQLKLPEATIDDKLINLTIEQLFYPIDYAINGDFRKLWKPFLCTASDITNNKLIVFTKGKLTKAIRASMAIPIIFKPIVEDTAILVDGGLYNNIPVKITKDSFDLDYIISVNVIKSKKHFDNKNINILEIGLSLIDFVMAPIKEDTLKDYGTYISPPLEDFIGYEFQRAEELIDIAYKETLKYIPKLQKDIKRREYYNTETNRKPIELHNFKKLIIDTIIIENANKFHTTIARNILNINKNDTFSINTLHNGIMELYALDMYENIHLELKPIDNKIKIILNENINKMWQFGLGIYYGNAAGMNIYGIIKNANIFNKGLSTNTNIYLGEYKKGIDINLYSPPIFISKTFLYTNSMFVNKKLYSIWSNTFNYFHYMNFLVLMGNSYSHNGLISLFASYKSKLFISNKLNKFSGGFFYNNDNLKYNNHIVNGQYTQLLFSINIPESYLSYSIDNIYMKIYGDYTAYFNINNFSLGINLSIGYLNTFSNVSPIINIKNDLFILTPLYSLNFKYDNNILANYFIGGGLYSHYKINNILGLSSKANVYLIENNYNENNANILLTYQFYIHSKLFSGKLLPGIEFIYTDNKPLSYSFNIFWGTIDFKKNMLIEF